VTDLGGQLAGKGSDGFNQHCVACIQCFVEYKTLKSKMFEGIVEFKVYRAVPLGHGLQDTLFQVCQPYNRLPVCWKVTFPFKS